MDGPNKNWVCQHVTGSKYLFSFTLKFFPMSQRRRPLLYLQKCKRQQATRRKVRNLRKAPFKLSSLWAWTRLLSVVWKTWLWRRTSFAPHRQQQDNFLQIYHTFCSGNTICAVSNRSGTIWHNDFCFASTNITPAPEKLCSSGTRTTLPFCWWRERYVECQFWCSNYAHLMLTWEFSWCAIFCEHPEISLIVT